MGAGAGGNGDSGDDDGDDNNGDGGDRDRDNDEENGSGGKGKEKEVAQQVEPIPLKGVRYPPGKFKGLVRQAEIQVLTLRNSARGSWRGAQSSSSPN